MTNQGADIGAKNPKKYALATFIDRSAWFLVWRLIFTKNTQKIWYSLSADAVNLAILTLWWRQRRFGWSQRCNRQLFVYFDRARKQHNIWIKGGVFYDNLGAEVGTQNPINGALATFINISGWFLVWRLIFTRTTPKIGDCSVWSA